MGFKISWIGFHGLGKAEILDLIGAADTGVVEEVPESPLCGAELPGGWYILFANDFEFVTEDLLARCALVACQLHEGVMYSAAYGYERGEQKWMLTHEGDQEITSLDVSGSPPSQFEGIRERLAKEQEDEGGDASEVDFYFDIPVETAEAVCGYRHDRWDFAWGQPTFTVLTRA